MPFFVFFKYFDDIDINHSTFAFLKYKNPLFSLEFDTLTLKLSYLPKNQHNKSNKCIPILVVKPPDLSISPFQDFKNQSPLKVI